MLFVCAHAVDGTLWKRPGKVPLRTNEGVAAVKECIEFLQSAKPLPPLERLSKGMCAAAADHAADLGKNGTNGHTGTDGSSPFDRLSRHGTWSGSAAENIACGDGSARDYVIQLLIDDGVTDRGHRQNLCGPTYKVLGIGQSPHPQFGHVHVQVFAGGFSEGGGGSMSAGGAARKAAAAPAAKKPLAAANAPEAPAALAGKAKPPPGGHIDVKKSMVTM